MIRRLTTAIRRLTRRQPTPPSEPHSRRACPLCTAPEHAGPCGLWVGERPDAGAASATVLLPAVRDADEHHAPAADMHRPDIAPRGWRFWRRTQLDAGTREWLDAMKAPTLSAEDVAWQRREVEESRTWGAEWWRVRWVLAERTEEMRLVLAGVEHKLLAGAR
jgi:hypothetical protein